jgi:hypothetical protein
VLLKSGSLREECAIKRVQRTLASAQSSSWQNSLERGTPIAEIANFLCRNEQEVRAKIAELEKTVGVSLGRRKG